jgi:hypothetical protein
MQVVNVARSALAEGQRISDAFSGTLNPPQAFTPTGEALLAGSTK